MQWFIYICKAMFVDWRLSHIEETFKMEDYEKNSLSQNDRIDCY